VQHVSAIFADMGRSPRARGKHRHGVHQKITRRSIPACAGETSVSAKPGQQFVVDPRVRGGNLQELRDIGVARGRSPRARGKHRRFASVSFSPRSIPACAGETSGPRFRSARIRVDPRVRGGNPSEVSHPRTTFGRSPRARGKLFLVIVVSGSFGSIPACAGETWLSPISIAPSLVDPRVRGGNADECLRMDDPSGRSPRARGKRS